MYNYWNIWHHSICTINGSTMVDGKREGWTQEGQMKHTSASYESWGEKRDDGEGAEQRAKQDMSQQS